MQQTINRIAHPAPANRILPTGKTILQAPNKTGTLKPHKVRISRHRILNERVRKRTVKDLKVGRVPSKNRSRLLPENPILSSPRDKEKSREKVREKETANPLLPGRRTTLAAVPEDGTTSPARSSSGEDEPEQKSGAPAEY